MKRLLLVVGMACAWSLLAAPNGHALSLELAPTSYRETLRAGEKKKAYVDVTNSSNTTVRTSVSVSAFRQASDSTALEFYNDDAVQAGILPDVQSVDLGPREVLRMYFVIDADKLPAGDVFAVIFFDGTEVATSSGVGQHVRVGTLLSLVNGSPGPRNAAVQALELPAVQFSEGLHANFEVKNTTEREKMSGFYPQLTISSWPYGQETVTGPLVFSGNTRRIEYVKPGAYLGLVKFDVSYQGSSQQAWAFVVTGYWRGVLVIGAYLIFAAVVFMVARRRYRRS